MPRNQTLAKKRDPRVKLTGHEKILMVVYRTLTPERRAAVDRALSHEWTRGPKDRGTIKEENRRLGVEMRALKAEHISGDSLVYFRQRWPGRER